MIFRKIQLITKDIEKAAAFYGDVLSLPILQHKDSLLTVRLGSTEVEFQRNDAFENPVYHFAFLIPGNLFMHAYEWIRSRVPILPFDEGSNFSHFKNWNANSFYFLDQQGNILEVISHFDLIEAEVDAASFSPKHFIGINEIGMPVENVEQTCHTYNHQYGIPMFHKGPATKEFAVMGDEYGMLIISKEGRGWLPTQEPSIAYPLVVFADQNESSFILTITNTAK